MEETKTCTKCGLKKSLTEFNFKNKAKGKRLAMCKECQRERERELYGMSYKQKNKERYQENRKRYRQKIRNIISEAKSCGCIVCGEKESCCLDFHHLRDKEFVIAAATDVSVERLMKELEKCIVLCANCHRKLHAGIITLLSGDEPDAGTNIILTSTNNMELKFKKLVENAVIPVRAHKGDAGLDLTCTDIQAVRNDAGQVMLEYHTGLAVEIPEGYVGLLFPRSSVWKKTLAFTNSVGVIDSGYRGELKAMMRTTTDVIPDGYHVGERFCQLVIVPIADVEVVETDEISASDRGESGFGSTGTAPLNNEYSAGEGNSDQSLPDSKDASTNFDAAEAPSGGEANIPEQA